MNIDQEHSKKAMSQQNLHTIQYPIGSLIEKHYHGHIVIKTSDRWRKIDDDVVMNTHFPCTMCMKTFGSLKLFP